MKNKYKRLYMLIVIVIILNSINIYADSIMSDDGKFIAAREVSQLLGAYISWDEVNNQVSILYSDRLIIFTMDSPYVSVNNKYIKLNHIPKIIDSRAMIPLYFVFNNFALPLSYEEQSLDQLEVIYFTNELRRASQAQLILQGRPNTMYYLRVRLGSGFSTAAGLGYVLSDDDGVVSFRWNIGGNTTFGTHSLIVISDTHLFIADFSVSEQIYE